MSKFLATVTPPSHPEDFWRVDVFRDGKSFYSVYYDNQDSADDYAASFNKDS